MAWPEVPPVPRARMDWVAQEAWLNGVPARLVRFESAAPVEDVLAHYRAHWRLAPAGAPREGRLGDWWFLSSLQGPYHLVVQVKPGPHGAGGSEGLLSTVHTQVLKPFALPTGWPRLDELQVRQVMESRDGAQHSHHLVATSDKGLATVRDRLMDRLRQQGWRVQQERHSVSGYLATCERAGETLDLAINPGTTGVGLTLVANWVRLGKAAP